MQKQWDTTTTVHLCQNKLYFKNTLGDIWVITYFCCEIKVRKGGRANKGYYLEGVTKPSLGILLYDTNKC